MTGWQDRLQDNYYDFLEFERCAEVYGLAERLGYTSAQDAWEANPIVQGSVLPSDYCRVENGERLFFEDPLS